VLASGETREISVSLVPGAVLAGTIRDGSGSPVEGLRVFAIDARNPAVPERLPIGIRSGIETRGVVTDDRGVYRLYGLAPGEYLVVAVPPAVLANEIATRSTKEMDAVLAQLEARRAGRSVSAVTSPVEAGGAAAAALAPTFYPGTLTTAGADRIRLAAGDERAGLDFVTAPVPVTTISGSVVNPQGPLPADLELSIAPQDTLQFFALAASSPRLIRRPGADGHFEFSTVTPGSYVIRARGRLGAVPAPPAARGVPPPNFAPNRGRGPAPESDDDRLYAMETLEMTGTPMAGLTLTLQPASAFRGRVAFDAQGAPPADLSVLRVVIQPVERGGMTVRGTIVGSNFTEARVADVRADGTFAVIGLAPGRYRVSVTANGAPASGGDSWLRSAVVEGRDVLDSALDVRLGADVTGAVLTLTDRRTTLSGTLHTSSGLPAPEYFIVVFPADPALRLAGSRRVKLTRPASDGSYSFSDLPAGNYRLVALTDAEPVTWNSAEFLDAIGEQGVAVRVNEDGARQDLRVRDP
jgi:hypothetical protein